MKKKPNLNLRSWQRDAFKSWVNNSHRGIFSVVTGGGKTIFALYCISHLFEEGLIKKALIIVPTKTLQDQWISNIMTHLNADLEDISSTRNNLCKFTVITNISAQKISKNDINPNSIIVLDECHRYGTRNNTSFLSLPFLYSIGLTATLERKYDSGVETIIKPSIGEVIYNYDVRSALKDGVVENYKMIYLKTNFSLKEQEAYDIISKKISKRYARLYNGNFNSSIELDKQLKLLLFQRSRIVNESEQRKYVATKLILENISRKKIVFCESISQAEEIKEECEKNGLSTVIYHSKMSRKNRLNALNSFHANYFHTLIGCKALDEGFDVPDIDFGLIVSQTKTSRQRIQRLGRTIRKSPGKNKPIVYTLYTTQDEFNTLYEEQFNYPYIETEWLEIT